jgi:LysM repeat protein
MDRICPYLALADDGRTVADGFDSEHRCHALTPPAPLERARQVQLCLTEAHVRCERFAAARTAWLAASSGLPRVAPDVAFGRTRLILESEPAWRNLASPPAQRVSHRALLIGAAGGAVVLLLVLGNALGILGRSPIAVSPTPSPSVTASATPTAEPTATGTEPPPSIAPTAVPTAVPTPAPTPAPTPRTYVVRQGDTLNEIAALFRTTAAAIAAANGISVNATLNVGQVLIIP